MRITCYNVQLLHPTNAAFCTKKSTQKGHTIACPDHPASGTGCLPLFRTTVAISLGIVSVPTACVHKAAATLNASQIKTLA